MSNIISIQTIVEQWIAAFNNHDVAAITNLYASDAELYDSGMKHPRSGREAIEQWFTTRFRTIPNISYNPTNLILLEAQEQAALQWTTTGTIHILRQKWLSRSFEVDGVSIFTLQDGRIQRQRGYYDHSSALEQVLPPLKWLLPRL